jgi:hypothetical protein
MLWPWFFISRGKLWHTCKKAENSKCFTILLRTKENKKMFNWLNEISKQNNTNIVPEEKNDQGCFGHRPRETNQEFIERLRNTMPRSEPIDIPRKRR